MLKNYSVEEIRSRHLLPDLDVVHNRPVPVMVIGQARSGTTVLCSLIRKYLKVNFGPESQFFIRLYKDLVKFGDLSDEKSFRRLMNTIAQERWFNLNQFGFKLDIDKAIDETRELTYPGAIDAIFSQFAHYNGMERWGDNTPEYVNHLPTLYKLFPDAQYIHIIRDGRDVALSCFEQYFGANNAATAAVEWANGVDKVCEFSRQLSPEQFYEIRYEDMLSDPVKTFFNLAKFLGIQSTDEWRYCIEHDLASELKVSNFNKWKQKLSRKEQLTYERVASQQLQYHAYETLFESPEPLTGLELKLSYADHMLKKYLNHKAWKDDWYKIKLRIKSLFF